MSDRVLTVIAIVFYLSGCAKIAAVPDLDECEPTGMYVKTHRGIQQVYDCNEASE